MYLFLQKLQIYEININTHTFYFEIDYIFSILSGIALLKNGFHTINIMIELVVKSKLLILNDSMCLILLTLKLGTSIMTNKPNLSNDYATHLGNTTPIVKLFGLINVIVI
jgi:hypothetical protein